jgi:hypothetical protein
MPRPRLRLHAARLTLPTRRRVSHDPLS